MIFVITIKVPTVSILILFGSYYKFVVQDIVGSHVLFDKEDERVIKKKKFYREEGPFEIRLYKIPDRSRVLYTNSIFYDEKIKN